MSEKKRTCPVSKRCGGCRYLDIEYREELNKKEQKELLNKQLDLAENIIYQL